MKRILGIDTGTNSLGWSIVECDENDDYQLIDCGVNIFQEGVDYDKNNNEQSRAAGRTEKRSSRKHYWRRKVRKSRLLYILSQAGLCPPLSREELREWRLHGTYPTSEEFLEWERTCDTQGINPYAYRNRCLSEQLNLDCTPHRYILGRALYHINQRRGFKSNRKDSTDEIQSGKVKTSISDLTVAMKNANCEYLGQYFNLLYNKGERVRGHYTAREEHYLAEFRAICSKQHLDQELINKLEDAIFFSDPSSLKRGL